MPRLEDLIRTRFDAQTIKRGQAYARNDQVVQAKVREERLLAVVEGQETYDVTIELPGLHIGENHIAADTLDCDCSCPIGYACKHAVAALIVWAESEDIDLDLHDQESTKPKPIAAPPALGTAPGTPDPLSSRLLSEPWTGDREQQQWLDRLTRQTGTSTSAAATPLYVLSTDKGTWLSLSLVLSRTLKNGRRGIAKRFHSLHSFLSHNPEAMNEDNLLVAAISGESASLRSWGWGEAIRSGMLLERVIATGRAVWDDVAGPTVHRLPPRRVTVAWKEQRDQKQRSKWRLEPVDEHGASVALIPVTPPWYRDGDGVGPLVSELDGGLLLRLAAMPWMAPALMQASVAALPANIPPPPGSFTAAVPRPWLLVHRQRRLEFWSNAKGQQHATADVAVVGFSYDEDEVAEGGPPLVKRGDGTPLVRNPSAERTRLEELERLGVVRWPPPKLASYSARSEDLDHLPLRTLRGVGSDDAVTGEITPAVLAALAATGWDIRGTTVPTVTVVDLTGVAARLEEHHDGDWFELHLGIEVGDARIDLVPLLTPLLRGGRTVWENLPRALGDPPAVLAASGVDRLVRVPLDLLADLHAKLVELFDHPPGPGGGWRIEPHRADLLDALDRLSPRWIGDTRLRALAEQLRSCLEPPAVSVPPTLTAELRPYQLQGLAWLRRLRALNIGGVLADDMGLGKTVQAISHLLVEHTRSDTDRASLVVGPASMVGVWHSELTRFAPTLPVTVLHGAGRERVTGAEHGVIITSYATLTRDIDAFAKAKWQVVIADEAQAFKNVGTAVNSAMRRLEARQRLCLTGTPVENHLGELHALLGWAVPGVLGTAAAFARAFRMPIEDVGDRARAELLRRRTAPFLLRRTKAAVANDLPPRSDIDLPVELGPAQRRLYEAIRLTMDERVREAVAKSGLARSGLTVLEALLRLRQVCCDPRLLPGPLAGKVSESAKLEALGELLTTLVEEKRQVLVFSQFTALLDLVETQVLAPAGIAALRLDGQSRNRADLVRRFQAGEAPVFLLSLKAGGTGLTLTAADTVVLLDPWWNPAVERQASDRAHRIGQQKPVTIYRLIASGTIESRIRSLQSSKAALADALLDDSGQALGKLNLSDIEALLAPVDDGD